MAPTKRMIEVTRHESHRVLRFHRGQKILGHFTSRSGGRELVRTLLKEGHVTDQEVGYLLATVARSELPEHDRDVASRVLLFCQFLRLPAMSGSRPSKKDGFQEIETHLN